MAPLLATVVSSAPIINAWTQLNSTQTCPGMTRAGASQLPVMCGDLDPPHLMHGSFGPPVSTSQMASRSVHQFLQGSRSWQTNQLTDRPRYSICSNRLHLVSAAMRPNNNSTDTVPLYPFPVPLYPLQAIYKLVLLRFRNFSCRSVSVGFAEKTSVFSSVSVFMINAL